MKWKTCSLIGAAFVCVLGLRGFGQQPERRIISADYSLYAGVLATRTMDYLSTESVLAAGGRELILPKFLVSNKPLFAAFSLGAGVGEIHLSRILRATHPKIARCILAGDILSTGIVAIHNEAIVPHKVK